MSDSRHFVHDMKNYLGIVIGYANLLIEEMPEGDPRLADVEEIRKAGERALALVDTWDAPVPGEELK